MQATSIQALVFDVFGTVVDWRSGITREGEAFAARHAITGIDWEAFAQDWRALYQPAMERVRSGALPFTKLDVLHRTNLDELLKRHAIAGVSETDVDHFNRAWHRLDPWPDVVEGLHRLKPRCILAPVSNGNVALMVNMARRAALPWDAILGAEVARAYKPQAQAYLSAVDMLGLKPHQVMMVAAHNNDLVHARSCGLCTAFIARPTEYGERQHGDFSAEHDFDVIADDFLDLSRQLG